MPVFHCKMCGGNLEVTEGMKICNCSYCDSFQTVPDISSERKRALFTKAHNLRFACEFDKAESVYDLICTDFPDEAEAYWGKVLCRYGIEYVDDPKTGRKIPTCHRTSFNSVLNDADFRLTLENSDSQLQSIYSAEAEIIDKIRENILAIASKEQPFDVFICYKETDSSGNRTEDSEIGERIYTELTKRGLKVFFSRETLRDKLGVEFEPYIFSAINTSPIMISIGTKPEYFDATWVRNEWSRFIGFMKRDNDKLLIPCYRNMTIGQMPEQFRGFQALNLGESDSIERIVKTVTDYKSARNESKMKFNSVFSQYETRLRSERSRLISLDREMAKRCSDEKKQAKDKFRKQQFPVLAFFVLWFFLASMTLPLTLLSEDISMSMIFWVIAWVLPPSIAVPVRYKRNKKAYAELHDKLYFDESAGSYELGISEKARRKYEFLNAKKMYRQDKFPTAMLVTCCSISGVMLGSILATAYNGIFIFFITLMACIFIPLAALSPLIIKINRSAKAVYKKRISVDCTEVGLDRKTIDQIYLKEKAALPLVILAAFVIWSILSNVIGIVATATDFTLITDNMAAEILLSAVLTAGVIIPITLKKNRTAYENYLLRLGEAHDAEKITERID